MSSPNMVNVKQEKIDPEIEIEEKLNSRHLPDSTNLQDLDGEPQVDEEKKNIESVKSSNEILAELFMVFNATPPAELLNIDKVSKKSKKEHKKSKRKKRKKRKRKLEKNIDESDNDNESLYSGKIKTKREKHKHKHKKSKENDYEKVSAVSDGAVIMAADSSSSSKLTQSIIQKALDETDIKNEKSYNKSECRSRIEKRLRKCKRVEDGSDISLSDEETYLRERSYFRDRETEFGSRPIKYERKRNSFYRTGSSYYTGERLGKNHQRHYDHNPSRSRSRHRTRTRSRSRSKERSSLVIDKKRLLEIARKNAITMFKSGSLPGCDRMSEEVKDKVLMKMRYGGKTVQDLTNFCRKLSKGEHYDDLSEFSSDEQSDVDKQGNAKAFHHPFVLKDREPIVMHIKNATPITPKTADQKKAITMQFPVSSGQQHRLKEGWVPVPAKESNAVIPSISVAKPALVKAAGVPKNIFQKQLPIEEQQPAFKPAGINDAAPSIADSLELTVNLEGTSSVPEVLPQIVPPIACKNSLPITPITAPPFALQMAPPSAPPITSSIASTLLTHSVPPMLSSTIPVPAIEATESYTSPKIFPEVSSNIDVSIIISQRLSAMRRLQENPMDSEAIKMMYTSQKEMTSWVSSKNMPGQFTGTTGANILTARELTKGTQAWARKDQLTSTVPVSGGMGMHLLKKMGWKPGEGLGREKTGSLQPLLLDVKLDKRGLVTNEEVNNNNRQSQVSNSSKRKKNYGAGGQVAAKQSIDSKHPVCLLNELSSKRKWTPPMYELVLDEGPSHNKVFVFSVNVNGQVFNPGTGGNTKKEAKMLTAKFCLQQMGVLSS